MSSYKEYLGDSVYADIDDFGGLVITTENGYPDDPRNLIVFEPEVIFKLKNYILRNFKKEVE